MRLPFAPFQATSGHGGWPMSVFLTPTGEPVTGGTYFPPDDKWGRPGFKTVLTMISDQVGFDRLNNQFDPRVLVEKQQGCTHCPRPKHGRSSSKGDEVAEGSTTPSKDDALKSLQSFCRNF